MTYPIIGWCSLPESLTRPEVFEAIRRSGVNVFMTCARPADAIRRQLDLAAEHGLRALVCDPRFAPAENDDALRAAGEAVAEYADHPGVFGFYVKDEPQRPQFEAVGRMTQFLRREAPDHVAYVNAYGFGARGADCFAQYVEEYARVIQPAFLSFDSYPISRVPPQASWSRFYAADRGYEVPELGAYYRDCYWEAWETFRLVGWKHNLPLWGFVLATPHQHSVWFYGPVTEGTLRLEAFTGLAYGAQAIQYFTLPTVNAGAWDDGILAPDGSPSIRFELFRRVNHDLAMLGPVVSGLTVEGVYFTGELTSGTRRFAVLRDGRDTSHRPVTRLEGDPVMISFLRGADGRRFALLVNRSPARAARVEIELESDWRLREVSKRDGLTGKPQGPAVLLAFEPGDGRLLQLERAADEGRRA